MQQEYMTAKRVTGTSSSLLVPYAIGHQLLALFLGQITNPPIGAAIRRRPYEVF